MTTKFKITPAALCGLRITGVSLATILGAWPLTFWLASLTGCGPAPTDEPPRLTRTHDAGEEDTADLPPVVTTPRVYARTDGTTGKRVLWDNDAAAVCERQPICTDCVVPEWDQNPQYCVPIGYWQGNPTGLTPFALGDWYADPFCSIHLYGMYARLAGKANPSWAYEFEEHRKRAKVYRIRAATAAETARPYKRDLYDTRVPCDRVTTNDMAAATLNFKLYIQVEEAPADRWVPWNEAQKALGMMP